MAKKPAASTERMTDLGRFTLKAVSIARELCRCTINLLERLEKFHFDANGRTDEQAELLLNLIDSELWGFQFEQERLDRYLNQWEHARHLGALYKRGEVVVQGKPRLSYSTAILEIAADLRNDLHSVVRQDARGDDSEYLAPSELTSHAATVIYFLQQTFSEMQLLSVDLHKEELALKEEIRNRKIACESESRETPRAVIHPYGTPIPSEYGKQVASEWHPFGPVIGGKELIGATVYKDWSRVGDQTRLNAFARELNKAIFVRDSDDPVVYEAYYRSDRAHQTAIERSDAFKASKNLQANPKQSKKNQTGLRKTKAK